MLLFLDLDDVLCLNRPYGGHHAMQALRAIARGLHRPEDFEQMWRKLFDRRAVERLLSVHADHRPRIVVSSSWAEHMDRAGAQHLFRLTGLDAIADAFHPRLWTTRDFPGTRAAQIREWLAAHPDHADHWVALDDRESGTGFREWDKEDRSYVVLCKPGVGLDDRKAEELRAAFERRKADQDPAAAAADWRYRRRLQMHTRVAHKLAGDPSLLEVASARLARWVSINGWDPYRRRWQQLLDAGPEACIRALTAEGEDADSMRRASPSLVLSSEERAEFFPGQSPESKMDF